MKHLRCLLLIVPLLTILLMVQAVKGQTEEEFTQEFQQYAETHNQSETQAYAMYRIWQISQAAIWEEYYWTLAFQVQGGPCLTAKKQICDAEFEAKYLEIEALSVAAMTACALTLVNPVAFGVCAGAVMVQHYLRMEAAKRVHRACYLKAYLECPNPDPSPTPTPNPNHCAILAPEKLPGSDDILPSLASCTPWEDPCICPPISPILVDVAGNGFDLTNMASGVMFNITGFGGEQIGWTRADSDDAFLALDLNANGLVDNGRELFGNFTRQPEPLAGAERNGFAALAVWDFNADGVIDSADPVYSELRLWQDRNHNGVSGANELHSLAELGLTTLELKYKQSKRMDRHGNEFRYRAKVKDIHAAQLGRWAWDVFLVSTRSRLIGGLH